MKLLVVVDMQNDFVSGALGTKEAVDIVPYVVGKVVEAVNAGTTVFTPASHNNALEAMKMCQITVL